MNAGIKAASGMCIDHLELGPTWRTASLAGPTTTDDIAKLFCEINDTGCDGECPSGGGGSDSGADRVFCGRAGMPLDRVETGTKQRASRMERRLYRISII
jgi:hypothetical protein